MRRMPIAVVAAALFAALAGGTAGCGGQRSPLATPTAHSPATPPPTGSPSADVTEAEIYAQVLRRYLGTPGENSFPQAFKTVYVLDQAYRDAADPTGKHEHGTPITAPIQHQVIADLAGMAHVTFIADRSSVLEAPGGGCPQVKNGGILITLGLPAGNGQQVQVGVNGWVACLGATWLTYILQNHGGGWSVTGTTDTMAIS
jgi:hypothetical protein